jgi:hypothetical protein
MIRAGAGLGEFRLDNAKELVQYAVRRGLISGAEGDHLLEEVVAVAPKKGSRRTSVTKKARARKKATPKKATQKKAAAKKKPAKKKATPKRAKAAKRTKRR